MTDADRYLPRGAEAQRESKYVEFKERFNPASVADWLELLKDFAALANVGGGVVVVGVRNDGSGSGVDVTDVLAIDGAAICDQLRSYIGEDFDDFEVHRVNRDGAVVAAIVVGPAGDAPLTFIRPGTYPDPARPDRQKSAFGRGVYFRHGAKSEPATRDDLRGFINRRHYAMHAELRADADAPSAAAKTRHRHAVRSPRGTLRLLRRVFDRGTAGARGMRARSPCAATPRHDSGRRSAPSDARAGSRRRRTHTAPSSPRSPLR